MAGVPDQIERAESGAGGVSSSGDGVLAREVEVKWLIHSVLGYDDAETRGKELAPLYYSGHRRRSLQCTPLRGGWYEIAGTYGNEATPDYDDDPNASGDAGALLIPVGISVDGTGGQEHITQAWSDSNDPMAYVGAYAATGSAPDNYGALNVSGDAVNGVDITVPSFNWTETWLTNTSHLLTGMGGDAPFSVTLADLTGKVNYSTFRGFERGEVMFMGPRYDAQVGRTMTPVTFAFSRKPNRRNFYVGDINVNAHEGWDYMEIQYETKSESNALVRKPKYVYVSRVAERKDFSVLNIGSAWPTIWLSGSKFIHPIQDTLRGVT